MKFLELCNQQSIFNQLIVQNGMCVFHCCISCKCSIIFWPSYFSDFFSIRLWIFCAFDFVVFIGANGSEKFALNYAVEHFFYISSSPNNWLLFEPPSVCAIDSRQKIYI